MNKKYCKLCGRKLIKIPKNKFDEATGKPDYDLECEFLENDCSKGHHNLKYNLTYSWTGMMTLKIKCTNCDYIDSI